MNTTECAKRGSNMPWHGDQQHAVQVNLLVQSKAPLGITPIPLATLKNGRGFTVVQARDESHTQNSRLKVSWHFNAYGPCEFHEKIRIWPDPVSNNAVFGSLYSSAGWRNP